MSEPSRRSFPKPDIPFSFRFSNQWSEGETAMKDLRCPNCNKKLAEVPDDYFDTEEGKDANRNKKKLFIKCTKCKQIIEF